MAKDRAAYFVEWFLENRKRGELAGLTRISELAERSGTSEATVRRALKGRTDLVVGTRGVGLRVVEVGSESASTQTQFIGFIAESEEHQFGKITEAEISSVLMSGKHPCPDFLAVRLEETKLNDRVRLRELAYSLTGLVLTPGAALGQLANLIRQLRPNLPFVVINQTGTILPPQLERFAVTSRWADGLKILVDHMLSQLGHPGRVMPKIALFAANPEDNETKETLAILQDAFSKHTLLVKKYDPNSLRRRAASLYREEKLKPGFIYPMSGEVCGRAFLQELLLEYGLIDASLDRKINQQQQEPIGICCIGSDVAKGVIDCLVSYQMLAGDSVHVAFIDSRKTNPGSFITCLLANQKELGRRAGELLLQQSPRLNSTNSRSIETAVMPRLFPRRSTADYVYAAFQNAPPSVIKDSKGRVKYCNRMFEALLGRHSQELLDKRPNEYWHSLGDAMVHADDQIIKDHKPRLTVERFATPSGVEDRFTYRFWINEGEGYVASMGFTVESAPASGNVPGFSFRWKALDPLTGDGEDEFRDPIPDRILKAFFRDIPISFVIRSVSASHSAHSNGFVHHLLNPCILRIFGDPRSSLITVPERAGSVRVGNLQEIYATVEKELEEKQGPYSWGKNQDILYHHDHGKLKRTVIRHPLFDGFRRLSGECSYGLSSNAMEKVRSLLQEPKSNDSLPQVILTEELIFGSHFLKMEAESIGK